MAIVKEPGTDPDNVPETLCVGKFNVSVTGPLALITFTHGRPQTTQLLDNGVVELESVVRARIVTTTDNLVALRDLLNGMLKDAPAATPATAGTGTLN
ncbi:MAG: hypothetical protein K2X60_12435 [Xanthobacteraceae bacterium]|nr:hypothetical protein [Xanthobacteraceae bacterium]